MKRDPSIGIFAILFAGSAVMLCAFLIPPSWFGHLPAMVRWALILLGALLFLAGAGISFGGLESVEEIHGARQWLGAVLISAMLGLVVFLCAALFFGPMWLFYSILNWPYFVALPLTLVWIGLCIAGILYVEERVSNKNQ